MSNAEYEYWIWDHAGRSVLVIQDMNTGKMSVTNDIENIILEIANKANINPESYMIVYRDTYGIWDGYDWRAKDFVLVHQNTWKLAVEEYVTRQVRSVAL